MVPADYIAAWIERGRVKFDVVKLMPGSEHRAVRRFAEKHNLRWGRLADENLEDAKDDEDALPVFLLFALDTDPEEICDVITALLGRQRAALSRRERTSSLLH